MKHIYKILLAIIVLTFIIATVSCAKKEKKDINTLLNILGVDQMNARLPEITLPDFEGNNVKISNALNTGKPALLSIWRSECHFCNLDMSQLVKLVNTLDQSKVHVMSVSWDTDRNKIADFKNKYKIPFPILIDSSAALLRNTNLNTRGTPTLFIINSKGIIMGKITGLREWENPSIGNTLKKLLAQL